MALVIEREDLFPVGASVAAYPFVETRGIPASGAPYGSATETETVQADGTVTFDALVNGQIYVLYKASPDRYLRVMPTAVTGSRGTVMWEDGGAPPRASGATFTDWIGPDDPAVNAIDGDTWIETEA